MVWWLSVRTALLKAWAWIKRNWKLLVGAAVPLAAWLLFRNRAQLEAYFSTLHQLREDHRKEVEAIDRARAAERTGVERARRQHDETVARVEAAAAEASVELNESKRQEIQALVQKYDGDPDGLAQELSRVTGIPMWSGEEE